MSRHGVLPEADFYCPIPWEPLEIATPAPSKRPLRRVATLC
ncbi:acyl-CoA dehydrogenase [Klebsiella pneumoniae]|uniref:Acyl-CoA dehydrogenase n=1 Tax=Klebsiella pneumoniae TaxID=573 RepID=A0A377X8Q3_KLEPN|nr:acyl-CoA dehydrogenase [Klebsiella pneumoniae]